MPRLVRARLDDIADAIEQIRQLLSGKSLAQLQADRAASAAFERFLEIISEASRHIPEELKSSHPEIPWRQIADIGNWLRHVYDRIDPALLWNIYTDDLDDLDRAIKLMIANSPTLP